VLVVAFVAVTSAYAWWLRAQLVADGLQVTGPDGAERSGGRRARPITGVDAAV